MFEVAGRKEESVRRQAVARLRNALQGTANHIASQAQQENWQEAVGSPPPVTHLVPFEVNTPWGLEAGGDGNGQNRR